MGAWFTPIVSIFMPWRIVVDCWQASAPVTGPYNERAPIDQGLVSSWWTTWISSMLLGWITAVVVRTGPTSAAPGEMDIDAALESFQTIGWLEIAECLCFTASACLAILLVRRLTTLQDNRAHATTPAPTTPTPAL
ncbi:DUF4328 domain-containing protein [Kitasatospora sp. NPDC054939]